jgi:pantoate--beta-alanine ligase
MCPIYRAENGLALSSRNARLTADEREKASVLYSVLNNSFERLKYGNSIASVLKEAKEIASQEPEFTLEYLHVVDFETLQNIEIIDPHKKSAICIAGYFGEIRLIDNIVF